MASKDLVSEEVLQELTNKIQEIVNNYCWNLEYFTPTEVEGFFDGTQQEIDYYSSLIKDDVVSKNFLHSSKQIADDIAKSIIEANEYTDSLLKNISSIQLEYVTSLPTSDISEHTIYILKASGGTSKDTLNLYNATDGWTSIGEFTIDLTNYIDRTTYDTDMDLKANKTEVIANDKINQTLDSTTNSSDTILSTSGLQTEMDKKANSSDLTSHTGNTDIHITTSERTAWNNKEDSSNKTTTINKNSTEDQYPTAKAVYTAITNPILEENRTFEEMIKTIIKSNKSSGKNNFSGLFYNLEGYNWTSYFAVCKNLDTKIVCGGIFISCESSKIKYFRASGTDIDSIKITLWE